MKKLIYITVVIITSLSSGLFAQNNSNQIEISPYIEQSVDGIPAEAHTVLLNKMGEALTSNGVIQGLNSQFIITANAVVSNQTITSTAPMMYVYELQLNYYIGNGIEGSLFNSFSTSVKGVGTTKIKAYIDAFKGIQLKNTAFEKFIEQSKAKITAYYNSKCNTILTEVSMFERTGRYQEAFLRLSSIPSASSCYTKANSMLKNIYQKNIDNDCKQKLANATNLWNANLNLDGANEVAAILGTINPESACFAQAKALGQKVEKRMTELDQREFKIRYEQEAGLEKSRIEAMKEIGKAYGNGQPQNVTYNTKYWW